MKHVLPDLPFAKDALQPFMSAETLEYHHGKHHRGYVEKLNQLVQGTEFESSPLEEIVKQASPGPIFNNAAQAWNHAFFWNGLKRGAAQPSGEFLAALQRDFGSLDSFKERFHQAAAGVFGSGWAWLVRNGQDGKLAILTTPNAENPLRSGLLPLITVDVWEHAYYIDYRNERAKYLSNLWSIFNWEFAQRNFGAGKARVAA